MAAVKTRIQGQRSTASDEQKIAHVARWIRDGTTQIEAAALAGIQGPSFNGWIKKFRKKAERYNDREQGKAASSERAAAATNGASHPPAKSPRSGAPASTRPPPEPPAVTIAGLAAYIEAVVDQRIKEYLRKRAERALSEDSEI